MARMVLYHGESNGPSLSVLAALEESGLDIECRPIDLLGGERHTIPDVTDPIARDFAVEGEGPVLVADGEAMSEAVFLAQFFDEQAGGCGLQPRDPYAHWQMMMWCRQATERLSPAVAYLGNFANARSRLAGMSEQEFETLLSGIASEDLRARWRELRDGAPDPGKIADSEAKIDQFAERAEKQLADGREWLMGSFSIADLETYGWMASAAELRPSAFEGKPKLAAWMERVASRPSVKRALGRAQSNRPRHAFAPGPEINRWG
jgi:glutathione S-transferase